MTQERVAYVNGEIVPESEASVSISDRGFIMGDAVFDTTRTFGHEIFRLDGHLDRLYESLKGKVNEVYAVGDCAQPRNIEMATYEAHKVALSI